MKWSLKLSSLLVMTATFFSLSAAAQDALQVMPTRLLLSDKNTGELTLVNKGNQAGTYRIFLRNIRTDEYGRFSEAKETKGNELYADEMIRFSPRRIAVESGSFQKVRVMLRKPKDLKPGEYRTHMVFQSLPEQTRNVLDETAGDDVDVAVQSIVELSIPIIVRQGKLDAEIEVGEIQADPQNISFTLNRAGTRSVYGDVEVFLKSSSAKSTRVGFARGLSVYFPNALRKIELPLTFPEGVSANGQELELVFTEDSEFGGKLSTKKAVKLTP